MERGITGIVACDMIVDQNYTSKCKRCRYLNGLVGLEFSLVKMAKPKPTITPSVIPYNKLQFLKKKNDSDLLQSSKRDFIKEIMRDECVRYQGIPIARYDMDVISLIKNIAINACDNCFEEFKF